MATEDTAIDLERETDSLYALPAADFVAARNDLVKRLKAAKRKDDSAVVAALRKPSVVAWALNQVARHDPDAVSILIDAAQGVADAQRDVMAGGDAKALRAASAAQRGAASEVTGPAAALAGANNADAVATTLHAALADDDLTERLRAGTLTETLDAPAGFGFGFATGDAPAPTRKASRVKAEATKKAPAGTTAPAGRGAEDRTDELAERRAKAEARKAVAKLEKDLAQAEKVIAAADDALAAAAAELDDAETALAAAQRRVADATKAHDDATAALDDATAAHGEIASALEDAGGR